MLKLVVDNRKTTQTNLITCRNSCELFDTITERCSIKENVNVDSTYETSRCGLFLHKSTWDVPKSHMDLKLSLIGEEEDYIIDDEEVFHALIGNDFSNQLSTYPSHPDFPSRNNEAAWYVSPDESFGCWIINNFKKPQLVPSSIEKAEKGWSNRVYKSPFPLHDHKSALPIASRIAWIIDTEGYGQYSLLVNGRISTLSSPKPSNWKN